MCALRTECKNNFSICSARRVSGDGRWRLVFAQSRHWTDTTILSSRAATLQRDAGYFGASCLYLMYCLYLRLISNKHFFCCYFEALREQTAFSLLRHSAASDAIQLLNKQYKALCRLQFKLSRLSSTQANGFFARPPWYPNFSSFFFA